MDIKKLNEELKDALDIGEDSQDPFKAVIDALEALGVEDPVIGQITPGQDVYEISYANPGTIFDDAVIRNIVSILEDEINELF